MGPNIEEDYVTGLQLASSACAPVLGGGEHRAKQPYCFTWFRLSYLLKFLMSLSYF